MSNQWFVTSSFSRLPSFQIRGSKVKVVRHGCSLGYILKGHSSIPTHNSVDFLFDTGWERKILGKETWFFFLREWKPWRLQRELFFVRDQIMLSPDLIPDRNDLKSLLRKSGVGVWGQSLVLMFYATRPQEIPPGTKPIHAGKNSWGINFFANACGACIRNRANTGKYCWGVIFCILAKFLREIISGRIHVAPVFAPARTQENIPGELFMYWFCARGYMGKSPAKTPLQLVSRQRRDYWHD